MSTRSNIAYDTGDSVRVVYCHSDGYLDYNGRILFEYYNSEEKARELINLGDFSSLKPTTEETRKKLMNCEQETYRSLDHYMHQVDGSDIEYIYLWDKYMWWISRSISLNLWNNMPLYERGYKEWIFYHSKFEPLAQELHQWDLDNPTDEQGQYV